MRATEPSSSSLLFFGLAGAILIFGLFMLASATAPIGQSKFGSPYYFIVRQILYGVLPGLIAAYVMWKIPVAVWEHYWKYMYWITCILLIIVFIPGFGLVLNGSRSWVNIGSWTLQTSEVAKLTFIMFLSGWLAQNARKLSGSFENGFMQYLSYVICVVFLLYIQPDVGTLGVFAMIAGALAYVAGAPMKYIAGLFGVALVGVLIMLLISPTRLQRIKVFLDPSLDRLGSGYHVQQALAAIGTGGVFGLGYGHSRQKYQYLPEVSADSIFPVIAEEMGFIVAVALIAAYMILLLKGLQMARLANSVWARYFLIGFVTWLCVQTFANIGAMLGLVPLTGLPLPMVSHGGSALVVTLAGFGVAAAIVFPPERMKIHRRSMKNTFV